MKFRTEIAVEKQSGFITHETHLMSVGSCFAEHIGQRLALNGFKIQYNLFGNIFNPVSIEKNIRNAFLNQVDENLIVERGERFYHYDFHSRFCGNSPTDLIQQLKQAQIDFSTHFEKTDCLFITLGTAWVYKLLEQDVVVANCHKISQNRFEKELLDLEGLKARFLGFLDDLKTLNPGLKIVLTVSPVRHIKNGLNGNNLSKSILLLMADYLRQKRAFIHYFPAYEMVIDDLRDYRFFNADMIHPNNQAADYVYDQFQRTFFSSQTSELAQCYGKLSQLRAHKLTAGASELEKAQIKRHSTELEAKIAQLKG